MNECRLQKVQSYCTCVKMCLSPFKSMGSGDQKYQLVLVLSPVGTAHNPGRESATIRLHPKMDKTALDQRRESRSASEEIVQVNIFATQVNSLFLIKSCVQLMVVGTTKLGVSVLNTALEGPEHGPENATILQFREEEKIALERSLERKIATQSLVPVHSPGMRRLLMA